LTVIGGGGGWTQLELGWGFLVPTLECGKPGVHTETVWKSESDGMGSRSCKDFVWSKEFIGKLLGGCFVQNN